MSRAPSLAIGARTWPGLAKLAEECAEVVQVIGKLAAYPGGDHPDGAGDLAERLEKEIADIRAATVYVIEANRLDMARIVGREHEKVTRFREWHAGEAGDDERA